MIKTAVCRSIYYLILDIDECATNTSRCNQICDNTLGGYSCSCRTGYQLSGYFTCVGELAESRVCKKKNVEIDTGDTLKKWNTNVIMRFDRLHW